MSNKKNEMLRSVDNLIRVHDEWENDATAPVIPTVAIEEAVELAVGICCNGDIPIDCQDLYGAVSQLAVEWEHYRNNTKIERDGRPAPSFWAAYRNMVKARVGAIVVEPRPIEPVRKLVEEKVPNLQIAKMYGQRIPSAGLLDAQWQGPFFDDFGRVLHELIAEEAEDPHSVIPADWVHPDEVSRVDRERANMQTRLSALDSVGESEKHVQYEDPATIEELLREGQFPATIAKVKRVSLENVLMVAAEMGMEPNDKDSDGPWVPPAEDDDTPDSRTLAAEDNELDDDELDDVADPEPQLEITKEMIDLRVIELFENEGDELSSADIARTVAAEYSVVITTQKAAAVIRQHKKSLASVEG